MESQILGLHYAQWLNYQMEICSAATVARVQFGLAVKAAAFIAASADNLT